MCNQSKKVGVECVIFEIMGSGVKYKAKKRRCNYSIKKGVNN